MKTMICGVPFEVKLEKTDTFNEGTLGEISLKESEIRIKEELSKELQDSILVHEYLHGILDMNGYHNESSNEQLLNCLRNELYQAGFRVPTYE